MSRLDTDRPETWVTAESLAAMREQHAACLADARQAALLEAAEALDAEWKRLGLEGDGLSRGTGEWERTYHKACGVQDAAALLRARAATPAQEEDKGG